MAYQFTPPTINNVTPFSEVLPYEKIFNQQLINQLAQQQLTPDLNRQQGQEMGNLGRQFAISGAYRTGQAPVMAQKVLDNYSRMLKEQTAGFTGQVNDWMTDWYNRQSEAYYKNPARFQLPTLPTFDQYLNNNPQYQTTAPTQGGIPSSAVRGRTFGIPERDMGNGGGVYRTQPYTPPNNPISGAYSGLNQSLSNIFGKKNTVI